jgi:Cdc6-like AAA superfamily ATPase
MVQDHSLAKAVAGIPQRSEKERDPQKLVEAFVDVGILAQIDNINSQIIYGRRGTGKTHVLKVLASSLAERARTPSVYIDSRELGSTAQFSDTSIPLPDRCTALFRGMLAELNNGLLEFIVSSSSSNANAALEELSNFADAIVNPVLSPVPTSISERKLEHESKGLGVNATLAASGPQIEASRTVEKRSEGEIETKYKVGSADKITFPSINGPLKRILELSDSTLYVLIDEWSSLPSDLQPFLAEFLKRSLLPLSRVVVKIASLEHRSNFTRNESTGVVGFELGADVSAFLDIDDYYVYDRNPDRITDTFGSMLVRHLNNSLPEGYLAGLGVSTGTELASRLFTERKVFQELVRASEGVARDLINIFSKAYFIAHRKGREKIERSAVLEAARQWFEQDKERNLDDELRQVLRRISDEVIGNRKARSFLLAREVADNPIIQRLFDLRILHLVHRGYADKDRPGVRYNIYSLDYGTYVDLLNTSRKPELGFDFIDAPDPRIT